MHICKISKFCWFFWAFSPYFRYLSLKADLVCAFFENRMLWIEQEFIIIKDQRWVIIYKTHCAVKKKSWDWIKTILQQVYSVKALHVHVLHWVIIYSLNFLKSLCRKHRPLIVWSPLELSSSKQTIVSTDVTDDLTLCMNAFPNTGAI